MQMRSFSFKTKDGVEHWVNRWIPDEDVEIKGIVQLHHGLAEHSLRYDRFGSIMAENGYVLNAYDMRGHGKTAEIAEANKTGRFGKLADKDGFNTVVEDLKEIIDDVKKTFEGKPVILLGHSFGSFVSQGYIEKYGNEITSCILCGTAGPRNLLMGFGKVLVDIVKTFKGEDSIVPLLEKIAFGSNNKRVPDCKDKNAWLSVNELNVELYNADQWCGFPLTTSFYKDMMSGLLQIHKSANMKKIPVDLPIYFIYGSEDPVGTYGKTIEKLFSIYGKNGIKKLEIKAYKGKRHEILNEDNKVEVENDIINWCNSVIA